MFCQFCGKETRKGAVYCSSCGKNLSTGFLKNTHKNKNNNSPKANKKNHFLPCVIVFIAIVIVVCFACGLFNSASIVGVWMDGTDQIEFTASGDFSYDSDYGTYTIDSDKTLEMDYGYYSYHSGRPTYQWGPEAKTDSDYWYVSGGTLYFRGGEYKKVN